MNGISSNSTCARSTHSRTSRVVSRLGSANTQARRFLTSAFQKSCEDQRSCKIIHRNPMDLSAIQQALRERNIDAWLFYDHHHRDPISYRVLGLPAGLMVTRRWYYLIPAKGEPVKLVHKIESGHLDTLPGRKTQYAGWQELFDGLKQMLGPYRDVAMQYSANNTVFTISMVDAGTAEMIRGLGKNIISAADLI